MKRLLLIAITALALTFSIGGMTALAFNPIGDVCSQQPDAPTCSDQQGDNLTGNNGVFLRAVRIIAFLAGSAAVILIIVAGVQYVISNGDASKVSSAKNTIIYAVIGLIIIFIAQAIITFVIKKVTS